MRPSKQEEQMNKDGTASRKTKIINSLGMPKPVAPYIQVTFRKEKDGLWHTYSAYGTDFDNKTGAEFMNCIGKAADVLNKKGGEE